MKETIGRADSPLFADQKKTLHWWKTIITHIGTNIIVVGLFFTAFYMIAKTVVN